VEHETAFIGTLRVSLLKIGGQQARASERTPRLDVKVLVSSIFDFKVSHHTVISKLTSGIIAGVGWLTDPFSPWSPFSEEIGQK
jgi:hypothetical protein